MALFRPISIECRLQGLLSTAALRRNFNSSKSLRESHDPRVEDIGRAIEDDYATIRARYREPWGWVSVWAAADRIIQKLHVTPLF